MTADDLRSTARKVLSSFKVPSVWLLVDSDDAIPRKATGKVDVRQLRALLSTVSTASRHKSPYFDSK
jgi:acyl-CoA synthetase (AMP-forming)/AMP-acid ligase II